VDRREDPLGALQRVPQLFLDSLSSLGAQPRAQHAFEQCIACPLQRVRDVLGEVVEL